MRLTTSGLMVLAVTLAAVPAWADFSYKSTRRITGGTVAQSPIAKSDQVFTYYVKGQKVAVVSEVSTQIFDFSSNTQTFVFKANRRYNVKKFSEMTNGAPSNGTGGALEVRITGNQKIIGGLQASQLLASIKTDDPAVRMEVEMWFAKVPGSEAVRALHRSDGGAFPWAAIASLDPGIPLLLPESLNVYVSCIDRSACGDSGMQGDAGRLWQAIASIDGIPVEQVVRVHASNGLLLEMKTENGSFSTDVVPESIFTIPEGFQEGALVSPATQPNAIPIPVKVFEPLSTVPPEYTPEARLAGLQGQAIVYMEVNPDGSVEKASTVQSLGMGLDRKAIEAVKQWRYRPGTAKTYASAEVNFELPPAVSWHVGRAGFRIAKPRKELVQLEKPVLTGYRLPEDRPCASEPASVIVEFKISKQGEPLQIDVMEHPREETGRTVVEAVSHWTFQPGTAGGQPDEFMGRYELQCGSSTPLGTPLRVGGPVRAPVPIYRPEPEYAEEARLAKYQGTVVLFLVVDTTGHSRALRVVRSLGLGLDQKAMEAISQWLFKPGTKDGVPVDIAATIEVNFRLL